jgi:hypothetical protein
MALFDHDSEGIYNFSAVPERGFDHETIGAVVAGRRPVIHLETFPMATRKRT